MVCIFPHEYAHRVHFNSENKYILQLNFVLRPFTYTQLYYV